MYKGTVIVRDLASREKQDKEYSPKEQSSELSEQLMQLMKD